MTTLSTLAGRAGAGVIALAAAAVLTGCGGGGNLPSSLPSSLPGSLPTRTTSTSPTTTSTVTTTSPATTTTATTSVTLTAQAPASTSTTGGGSSSTPWGWIALAATLVALAVAVAGWALGRRGGDRRRWRSEAWQASVDGTSLHDRALGELMAAATTNRPEQWTGIATAGGGLAASLGRLRDSAPGEQERVAAQAAADAAGGVAAGAGIAQSAPSGSPLDEMAARTLRGRIEQLAAALEELREHAGGG